MLDPDASGTAVGVAEGVGLAPPVGVLDDVGMAEPEGVTDAVGEGVLEPLGAAVGVELLEGVAVGVTVGLGVGGVVAVAEHVGVATLLVSKVTAALLASSRPVTCAFVSVVTDVNAKTVPMKVELVPNVAELATCQKMLQALAPLTSFTLLAEAVINVLWLWKMNTAVGSFCASRVSVPVRPRLDPVYTPGTSV